MNRKPIPRLAGILCFTAILPLHAELLVYEGFEYSSPGDPLHGQPDGSGTPADVDAFGLGGTWQDQTSHTSSDFRIVEGSLVFGDLPTKGNHVAPVDRLNNDIHVRPITADLAAGGELWFSILAEKVANNFSNGQGGLVIGNQAVNNSQINKDTGSSGLVGFGFGPTTAGTNWTPFAWDGTTQTAGDDTLPVGVGTGDVRLLVGHISFNTGTAGADEYTLYHFELDSEGSIENGTLVPIGSTIEIDVDETLLNTLSLTRHVETSYDEIRIGTTLASVIEAGGETVPEETFALTITPAEAPGTGYDLEWESQSGKLYNLYTSTDLAGPINTWTLLEDDIEATPPANVKNVPEDGPRRFYAVEEFDAPPPPPLFSADFEDDDGGFTVVTTGTGSTWQHGEPDSADLGGGFDVTTGNDGSAQAWGVNLTGAYAADTVTSLRSPAINLGSLSEGAGAALEFALAIDIASDASLVVRVIEEASDNVIGDPVLTISGQTTANWDGLGPFPLPVEAIGEVVRIEWLFTGPDGSIPFLGVYLDDVVVTETNP